MPPIKILRQSDQTELTPAGRITTFVRIDFMVGDDGPFSESIPKTDYNAETVHAKLQAFAQQIAALHSKISGS